MSVKARLNLVHALRNRSPLVLKLCFGCAGLAVLSACSSGGNRAYLTSSANNYLENAPGNYRAPGPPSDPWGPYITLAATRFDVPATWIRQVMRVESGGHEYIDGHLTVSAAGAMGLMQLEPETYQEMAARYGLGSDPFNPYDNIMAGTAYIHEMYIVYGSPGFLAAYDAGPGRLNSFMDDREPLPDETVNYVAMIAPNITGYYPEHRSDADQLALNTDSINSGNGILPQGFVPMAGAAIPNRLPEAPETVEVAKARREPEVASSLAMESEPVPHVLPTQLRPEPPHRHHFSVVPEAMADTPPEMQVHISRGERPAWAIQVGAYDTSSNARAALGIAELSAIRMLVYGHPVVISIHRNGHVTYRARVVGLLHDDAVGACNRLSTGPTRCVVLSPEAQS